MPRKPVPPPVYSPATVARARAYLLTHYPAQAAEIATMPGVDAVRCQKSREEAFRGAERYVNEYMARPAGVRQSVHARRCGAVGGRIGGRILTPASLAARRASSKLGAAARSKAAKAARAAARRKS